MDPREQKILNELTLACCRDKCMLLVTANAQFEKSKTYENALNIQITKREINEEAAKNRSTFRCLK
jgi:hypothetical protein